MKDSESYQQKIIDFAAKEQLRFRSTIRKKYNIPRIIFHDGALLDDSKTPQTTSHRYISLLKSEQSDITQLFDTIDSSDVDDPNVKVYRTQRVPIEPWKLIDDKCQPLAWQTTSFPTCNSIHELDMLASHINKNTSRNFDDEKYSFEMSHIALGGGRDVWRVDEKTNTREKKQMVVKTLRWKKVFDARTFENTRLDSMAMERLTSSPYILDIYGYCGTSVVNDFSSGGSLQHVIEVSENLPSLQKLKLAINIAQSYKDLHSIDCVGSDEEQPCIPSFVQSDMSASNFMLSSDGKIKLNDFNSGVMLYRNPETQESCGFRKGITGLRPDIKSPEECQGDILTEKIDVFGIGGAFYILLTGKRPYEIEHGKKMSDGEKLQLIMEGREPTLPDHVYRSEDPAVVAIKRAMKMARTYVPKERPSAGEIVKNLTEALSRIEKSRL